MSSSSTADAAVAVSPDGQRQEQQNDAEKYFRRTKKVKKSKTAEPQQDVEKNNGGDDAAEAAATATTATPSKKISMPVVPSAKAQTLIPLDITDIVIASVAKNEDAAAAVALATDQTSRQAIDCCQLARSKEEKQALRDQLLGGMTAFQRLPIDALKKYKFVVTKISELTSENIPNLFPSQREEFCICAMYAPQFIDAAVKLGLLPMTISMSSHLPEFLAPKLHTQRCIIRLPASLQNTNTNTNNSKMTSTLVLPHGIRKKSKKFALLIDGGFWDICCRKLVEQHTAEHGHSWLNEYQQKAYLSMNIDPEKFETNMHAIVLVFADSVPAIHNAQEQLRLAKSPEEVKAAKNNFDKVAEEAFCAGELGCSVGSIYTSLTGGYVVSGTGSTQLGALAALLVKCGYETWDLGMAMPYKVNQLGGIEIRRNQWLQMAAEQSKKKPLRKLGTLDGYVVGCDHLIDSVEYFQTTK